LPLAGVPDSIPDATDDNDAVASTDDPINPEALRPRSLSKATSRYLAEMISIFETSKPLTLDQQRVASTDN
ncbi:MAG: hypothetical protein AAGF25_13805, partial [Pseudomonadota bacterium]